MQCAEFHHKDGNEKPKRVGYNESDKTTSAITGNAHTKFDHFNNATKNVLCTCANPTESTTAEFAFVFTGVCFCVYLCFFLFHTA